MSQIQLSSPEPPVQRGSGHVSGPLRGAAIACAAVLGLLASTVDPGSASATDNPHQRGPNPSQASISANRGTFATAETSVGSGNGFGAAKIYYPTDTGQGTFGAIAVSPGYTATWAAEGAWMGHWLASFGFVVIGIDTINRNDFDVARGTQLLAALDYLTQRSSVRTRVDPSRLAVMGHSMGGGGTISAALRRPTLKAAIGLAPYSPSQTTTGMQVPTVLLAGQNDGTSTPASIITLHNNIPASTEKAYLELTGAGHGFPTSNNSVVTRKVIPWMKIFIDQDTRYTQFLCPLQDWTGIRSYRNSCPLLPNDPGTTFSLAGSASGKCVDVPGRVQTNGTGLIIWTCNGAANQHWTRTAAGELRIYGNSKCMDASGQGARVTINSCNGGSGQKWTVGTNGTVTNAASAGCLDTGGTADNAPVIVTTCNGGSGQIWIKRS
ncbi:Dienelactone hydrolase [Lentzea albidocapillata subsp. violacea]|uniref:Dienelactone hydrolase n=1 Tax=Lentzea albidocapillata subsp. violacea TaxID=128104 RepID=A0A1G8Q8L3_9PSEU|nr:ricin-type beta-trefoil lectin domain protein [Lentzea albidocapillata]SDJ00903.1 Dienelactone hydrolase [Lentzea albidocapillata subsp. violacea]